MESFNLEKLVKIVINDFCISRWYYYSKRKSFLGITTKKEGVYSEIWNNFIGIDIPQNFELKDNVLYEKPEVVLCYESDIKKTYIFNTLKEATDFRDEIKALSSSVFIS